MTDKLLAFIRGIVRPVLTAAGFGAIVYFISIGTAIPDWFQGMVAVMVGYWFGSRGTKQGG